MNNVIKFKWNGGSKHEAGIAIYEVGASTYAVRFQTPIAADKMHMALRDAYRSGYESGVYNTKAAVQSALAKIS
jgi:hypothetical protein